MAKVKAEELAAEYVDPSSVIPWPDNPRKNDKNVPRVKAFIEGTAFGTALLARRANRMVIAGHTRLKAALELKAEGKLHSVNGCPGGRIPVRFIDVTQEAANRMALADNRLNELSDWDEPLLHEQLAAYSQDEAQLMGWSIDEVKILADSLRAQQDEASGEASEDPDPPDLPKTPVTQPGDVWLLGDHVLVCGDSRLRGPWDECIKGDDRPLDMVFTDPPYGVDYVGKTSAKLLVRNDDQKGLKALLEAAFDTMLGHSRAGACYYVCSPSGPNMGIFGQVLNQRGLWKQSLVWQKQVFVLGHSDYHYQHEPIFYGWKPGKRIIPPDRKQTSLWPFDRPSRSETHPTMKPVKLVAHALAMSSRRGDLVGDGFGGSGTLIVAAEQLQRRARVIELDQGYCDVQVERFEKLTGKKAKRRRSSPSIVPPANRKRRTSAQAAE